MKSHAFLPAVALAASLALAGTPAHATLLDWTFTGSGISGEGTLTVTGTASPFDVTDITGTFMGLAATSLTITGLNSVAGQPDNLLLEPAPFVDNSGISFN